MALWWIKGVQKATDEAIEYLMEADTEAVARQKAESHGIAVGHVSAHQGSTELSAIRAELAQIKNEVASLRNGVLRKRNRLRDKPVWTIAIGVFLGLAAFLVIIFSLWVISWAILIPNFISPNR